MAISFQVKRSSICETQFVDHGNRDLAPGEVRFDIDFVALTSNNVTYAVAGDLLNYWGFFPVGLPWGHVPAMGYGTVVESANGDVEEGARHFGFFPMAEQHIVLVNGTDAGLFDIGAHRAPHARTGSSPMWRRIRRGTPTGKHTLRCSGDSSSRRGWPRICCSTMTTLVPTSPSSRAPRRKRALRWAGRFNSEVG